MPAVSFPIETIAMSLIGPSLPPAVLLSGYQLKQFAQLNYELVRVPERRFDSQASIISQAGTIWSSPRHIPSKNFRARRSLIGTPKYSGDDYAMQWQIRSGRTFGSVPFDELFMLGMERDNDLWMRGHVGTRDGQKGSAPLGRNYFLSNWEIDKRILSQRLLQPEAQPIS